MSAQGIAFTVAGAILGYCGFALITNHRGFADWFQESERRRRELSRGGTVWRPDRYGTPKQLGVGVLVLGLLFLAGGVTS